MPICPNCGNLMHQRVFDDVEDRYYWECLNSKPDGSICWTAEWEEDL